MKPFQMLISILIFSLTLAACTGKSEPTPMADQENDPSQGRPGTVSWKEGTTLVDDQGAVTVEITPLNPNNPGGETLDFQVTLDTHSVDLSMKLAELATLTTDTGKIVQAIKWDAPLGGHHVEGILSFPAIVNATQFLEEASTITLTLVNLDAPERIFIWER
jgi:hypothetical protein